MINYVKRIGAIQAIKLLCLILVFSPISPVSKADQVVLVPDEVDCSDGHLSDRCGWGEPGFGFPGESPGGDGGGGGDREGTGPSPDAPYEGRKEPACLEEQIIMADIWKMLSSPAVQSGTQEAPGTVIRWNYQLNDPQYTADPNWVKKQVVANWGRVPDKPDAFLNKVVIHYMFNMATKAFDQMKFKNTPEKGCSKKN